MQYGYRHLAIGKRLLRIGNKNMYSKILQLRKSGIKTIPAFANFLLLTGDPYKTILGIESLSDVELSLIIKECLDYANI